MHFPGCQTQPWAFARQIEPPRGCASLCHLIPSQTVLLTLLAWMFPLTTFISWYLLLRLLSGKGFYNLLSADWHRSDWVRNAFLKLTCSCCSGGRIQAQVLGFLTLNQFFFQLWNSISFTWHCMLADRWVKQTSDVYSKGRVIPE